MHQYLKNSCSLLVVMFTFLTLPRGWAQERPAGSVTALPEPPRGSPPLSADLSADESLFTYATVGFQSCKLPCRLYLQPGVQPVIATGSRSFVSHLEMPAGPVRIDFEDVTGGYRIAGAVLIPTGIVSASSMWAIGLACGSGCLIANATIWPVLGISAMFTGIGLLGWSAGRDRYRVRVRPGVQLASRGLRLTSVAAAPSTDGAAMGASFAF